jgi:biopolymer transport protein ExbD
MRAGDPGRLQAAINVTPLVDVVLVLLIIFMVLAPQLDNGPALELPATDRPPEKSKDGRQIVVVLQHDGALSVERVPVAAAELPERIQRVAAGDAGRHVMIEGDARLSFGAVREAMLAVESAGFTNVGLLVERQQTTQPGG